ncbi:DMT family transporter [Natronoglycomyces albus]|uniref:DMT family transporter n=1 Tax=Natronoglycomyces albus TaxID=2811108 RepID=A0A895XT12_9ACTN|nr:DMT family transporter [Natronoglycomyces albus]QSB06633.1 DMT family transporter [Natronoglycomyces albus]
MSAVNASVTSSAPGHGRRSFALPASAAVLVAITGGAVMSGQSAVNGLFGTALGSALAAAVISNLVGGSLFTGTLLASPAVRMGMRRLWHRPMPLWMYCGGVFGALIVLSAAVATPVIGVALFMIAIICGNIIGGLCTDAIGLSPAGKMRPTRARLLGSALAIAAIAIAQSHAGDAGIAWALIALAFAAGAGGAVQASFNGHVNLISGNVLATGFINFLFGTGVLLIVAAPIAVHANWGDLTYPSAWWMYLGGVCGAAIVICATVAVRHIGALGLALGALTGQLAGAILLDVAISGQAPSWQVLTGAALAALAAWLATRPNAPRRVRPTP